MNYSKWYKEFGGFLREGVLSDFFKWKDELPKVLRYESSAYEDGKTTSLEGYISRMKPEQKEIYYLLLPARSYAETSPYYEGFKSKNLEVLFLFNHLDDLVLTNIGEFNGKKIINAEAAKIEGDQTKSETDLTKQQVDELCGYIRETLYSKVTTVRETKRITSAPALVVDHDSAVQRRMVRMIDPSRVIPLPKQVLEINARHPILKKLFVQKSSHPILAKEVIEQIFDNALVAAGLFEDPRAMTQRINLFLEKVLDAPTDLAASQTIPKDAKGDEVN